MAFHNRKYEMILASASFTVDTILAFLGMAIHEDHDIAAGVCMTVAQFLILTASIIGIDYKLNQFGSSYRDKENQRNNSSLLSDEA